MNCEVTPLGKLLAVTVNELPGFTPPMVTTSCVGVPSCAATTVLEDSDIVAGGPARQDTHFHQNLQWCSFSTRVVFSSPNHPAVRRPESRAQGRSERS